VSNISVAIHTPLRTGARWLTNAGVALGSYKHVLAAFGGYQSASFQIGADRRVIEDWWEDGIGRHIETYDDANMRIWEGFVNQITVNMGAMQLTRGPLVSITNQVAAYYSQLIHGAGGLVTDGVQKKSTTMIPNATSTSDTEVRALASQAEFGVWQRKLSIGKVFDADAEAIQLAFLRENCLPEIVNSGFSLSRSGDSTITVECLGYAAYLDAYTYTNDQSLACTTTEKIEFVLQADPNQILARDWGRLADNGTLVDQYEKEDQKASAIIKNCLTLGGTGDRRWLFGVYNDRVCYYQPASLQVDYYQILHDPRQRITDLAGGDVKPWLVQPGRWILFADLLPMTTHNEFKPWEDPAAMFIESVTYTAPYGLDLSGSKVSTLQQKLARMGLAGISA
jgi:hypothetical protein